MTANFSELEGNDAYDLLGVDADASEQDIRRAYRALARSHHPDLHLGRAEKNEAHERIRLLNAARDALTDHRSEYDAFRRADDIEEPADEEIIDDPWATAQVGTPPPKSAPTPGFTPQPTSTWFPIDYGPTPPPQYGHPPTPARPHGAPMRLRDHQLRRPVGCALFLGAIVLVPLAAQVIADLLSKTGTKPPAPVPGSLAGTWNGTVKDKSGRGDTSTWTVELTLRSGRHNGDVDYRDGRCSGTAVPVSYKGGSLTVSTDFSGDQEGCDVGDFQIVPKRHRYLAITYRDRHGKVVASGDLKRA